MGKLQRDSQSGTTAQSQESAAKTTETLAADVSVLEVFRNSFRKLAGGVVVITAVDQSGEPVGFTATSFASLSASPPRATLNVMKSSTGYRRAVSLGNRLVVNVLGVDSLPLGTKFAGAAEQRFAGDHWAWQNGLPVIQGAAATMFTEIHQIHDHDENAIVVLNIIGGSQGPEQDPLIYHDRKFGTLIERS